MLSSDRSWNIMSRYGRRIAKMEKKLRAVVAVFSTTTWYIQLVYTAHQHNKIVYLRIKD